MRPFFFAGPCRNQYQHHNPRAPSMPMMPTFVDYSTYVDPTLGDLEPRGRYLSSTCFWCMSCGRVAVDLEDFTAWNMAAAVQ